ncbi:DUF2076 domain-containing protein|uniref:DUF2076 domain-containing protein n=1 Tax=Noviherbaspirillum sp. L7-7A TaxID=2850560 RepID=UPI001C2C8036|nr:DUF2076 domain-containing protein [Noviherbaspirillum sp. L7-7A]MBV0878757.1 DUF2076 domain-containing protein [Noviherbaspirillum sp. L7-7A]
MTPQEQEKLQQFLSQLKQAGGVQRDPDADAMINAAVSRQPDAAYLLVQRTLLQDQALETAQARIAELERQAQAARPASSGSFLGGADTWGNSARSAPAPASDTPERTSTLNPSSYPQAGQGAYPQGQVPYPGQRQGGWSRFGGGGMGGGGGSFLGTMAATAAGVAGGAFLFQGLGNLLNSHHGNDAGQQHGLTSDTGAGLTPAADNSLAQDAGLNDISTAPAQETQDYGVADNNVAFDDGGMSDDFGGGDDSMI